MGRWPPETTPRPGTGTILLALPWEASSHQGRDTGVTLTSLRPGQNHRSSSCEGIASPHRPLSPHLGLTPGLQEGALWGAVWVGAGLDRLKDCLPHSWQEVPEVRGWQRAWGSGTALGAIIPEGRGEGDEARRKASCGRAGWGHYWRSFQSRAGGRGAAPRLQKQLWGLLPGQGRLWGHFGALLSPRAMGDSRASSRRHLLFLGCPSPRIWVGDQLPAAEE